MQEVIHCKSLFSYLQNYNQLLVQIIKRLLRIVSFRKGITTTTDKDYNHAPIKVAAIPNLSNRLIISFHLAHILTVITKPHVYEKRKNYRSYDGIAIHDPVQCLRPNQAGKWNSLQ